MLIQLIKENQKKKLVVFDAGEPKCTVRLQKWGSFISFMCEMHHILMMAWPPAPTFVVLQSRY